MTFHTRCPAKINLMLRIGEKDESGYHPLETKFLAISFFDELSVTPGESGFSVEGSPIPRENTLTQTLRLASEAISLPPMKLHLVKRIPDQAGLGGGSSDAAGLLRIIRRIVPGAVPAYEFESIAKTVGADVPFFLHGGYIMGRGYGEKLTRLPERERHFLLLFPEVKCSTLQMYGALDRYRSEKNPHPKVAEGFRDGWIENDFHDVMPPECQDAILTMIQHGAKLAGLSGSGSTVFGEFATQADAKQATDRLKKAGFAAKAVEALPRLDSVRVTKT